jgi:hypothetical protein
MNNKKAEELIRFIILILSLAFGLMLQKIIYLIIGAVISIIVTIYFRYKNKRKSSKK